MLADLPATVATRLVVAFIAHHEQRSASGVELSARTVQRLFRRRSHQTGSDILDRAVDGGWLTIVQRHAGRKAHSYGLGPTAIKEQAEWREAGAYFFGEDGVMSPWLTKGWMYEKRRSGLDIAGCCVLAVLGNDEMTPAQIARRSHGFVNRAAATRELGTLAKRDIVARDADRRPATFRCIVNDEWFETQERELWLAQLSAKDDERIAEERDLHDHAVGRARREYREWLRTQACVYCVRPGSGNEPIQIEHLPPRKLGGGPMTGFEIPAHGRCHGAHSSSIRRFGQPLRPAKVFVIEASDEMWAENDEDLLDLIVSMAGDKVRYYVAAINSGDVERAEHIASLIAEIGAAAAPQGAFIVRHKQTGAERELEIDRWFLYREFVATARAWMGATLAFAGLAPTSEDSAP